MVRKLTSFETGGTLKSTNTMRESIEVKCNGPLYFVAILRMHVSVWLPYGHSVPVSITDQSLVYDHEEFINDLLKYG